MLLLIPAVSSAAGRTGLERIELLHADTLRSRGASRQLIGHVKVRRGATLITADRALYNTRSGEVTLTGNVKLNEPERKVTAERMVYNEFSGNFEASRNVDMYYGDSLRIRSRLARYDETAGTIDLFGNLIIDNLSDGARITGNHGRWNQLEDNGVIDQSPVYRLPDEKGDPPDTLVIVSRYLQFDRAAGSALFTGSVKLTQSEIRAESDSLHHLPDSSLTVLSGNPVIWRGEDELTGRVIRLYYEERSLKRVVAEGDASVLSGTVPDDPRRNHLTGDRLTMTTIDDSTRVILVEGDAQGEYHVWDERDVYQGVNLSAADAIELTIVSERVTSIVLEGRSNGVFYPPGQIPEGVDAGRLNVPVAGARRTS
ncbi:MAG TPA: hypothetical protein ENL08_02335 [Bacteroidetes bacterium]|nr:hypothetical protein [Bacteroidota bacterium]